MYLILYTEPLMVAVLKSMEKMFSPTSTRIATSATLFPVDPACAVFTHAMTCGLNTNSRSHSDMTSTTSFFAAGSSQQF